MRLSNLRIHDIAFGGKGIAREKGKVVFVPYTIEGELVSAEILREKRQFAEAEVVEIKDSSPNRVTPHCPYFGRCGGCSYQHIDYQHQLDIKTRQVRDALQRIGRFRDLAIRPIVPSPRQYGYRNRITVHAQDGVIGFFRRDSHCIVDIEWCPISRDEVNDALAALRKQKQVRDGHHTLRGTSQLRAFSQVNDEVAQVLRNLVIDLVPPDQRLLIDAYCGAGFFAKGLLDKFERVIGIDWDRFAIAAANKNATGKETYVAGDVEQVEAAVSAAFARSEVGRSPARDGAATTMIVDPPASGLTEKVRMAIIDLAPDTLLYVSCHPPTLARDLRCLREKFAIESVTPLDMFPQTAEIEILVHLSRSA